MTDFHSHILPGVDDGSRDVSQSLSMLRALHQQGVEAVALTPHFYAKEQNPEQFLQRRARAFEQLSAQVTPELPAMRLGAEVLYFRGISQAQSLPDLCLEGTRLLLLEMPTGTWTQSEIGEVRTLARSGVITVLLAHIERYWFDQKKTVWEMLQDDGVLFQINTHALQHRRLCRPMIRLIRNGAIYALGTDCHDNADRGPDVEKAREIILRRAGQEAWERLDRRSFDDEP